MFYLKKRVLRNLQKFIKVEPENKGRYLGIKMKLKMVQSLHRYRKLSSFNRNMAEDGYGKLESTTL